MTDYTPPTDEEVRQSRDPAWLREQADQIEINAHDVAERLRDRAYKIEIYLKTKEMDKVTRILGAKETQVKNWQREN